MSQTARRHRISDAERYKAVTAARERFLAGDDRVRGVRPEVATSWYRCREQYRVDPGLSQAPPASAQDEHSSEHTLEHWPEELYLPGPMVDRTNWDQWAEQGSRDWRQRAREVIAEKLANYEEPPLDEAVHAEIRRLFTSTCKEPDVALPALSGEAAP